MSIEYDPIAVLDFVEDHFGEYTSNAAVDEMVLMCPFCHGGQHEEISFNINLEKGAARCWRATCDWRGTVVKMIRDYLDCDWDTAYKIAGGTPPEDIDEILAVLNSAQGALSTLNFGMEYSHMGRIDVWPHGTIPFEDSDQYGDICDWLYYERGYDPDRFCLEHDVYVCPEYDRFDRRALFMVRTNNQIAYQAYAYDKEVQPKTLNPPGAVLSRMLYNYDEVKTAATVFICEGIFDAARLIEQGFYAVCVFGANLSITQAFLLADLPAEELCVCLDNGADDKAMEMLKKLRKVCGEQKKLSLVSIDVEGADPDSLHEDDFARCFLKRRHVTRAQDSIDFLLKMEN